MNMNYKKGLKFLTLLIMSILIATVSAQVYSYMYIEGGGTITGAQLSWAAGTSMPGGTTIQGAYVKNLNLSIPQNTPRNITDCVHLVNNNSTGGYTFSLEVTAVGGDPTKFTTFDLVLSNAASGGTRLAAGSLKATGTIATGLTIAASGTLYIRFEVDPVVDQTSGYMWFTIKLTYE
jgi:hypothetical protein